MTEKNDIKREKPKKVRFRRTKKVFLAESFKAQHQFIGRAIGRLFNKKHYKPMNFAELHKIGIDEEKITALIKRFTILFRICLLIVVVGYFYMLYLFIYGHPFIAMISLSVILIGLANAFKFHFWRYQLLQKKLGCTFKEWLLSFFKRGDRV